MAETVCPMTPNGLHLKRPWQDAKGGRSGLACKACKKTWEHFRLRGLRPTYEGIDEPVKPR